MTAFLDQAAVQLTVALGLGLLVGMQREWVEGKPLGLRSFALITVIGALVGLYAAGDGIWIIAAGLVAVSAAIFTHTILLARNREVAGMTTELAGIAMYLVGAMTTSGWLVEAVVLGGIVTLLLHWKRPMHAWIDRIEPVEIQAVARFVLVSLVILPVLPNETFGPYNVLNPFQIWLMVVLIVGLNLIGYFAMRVSSGRGGALLGGVLGGLVSSTATAVSFSRRSRDGVSPASMAALVILIASQIVYARIVIETLAVAPSLLVSLVGPLLAFNVIFLGVIGLFLFRFEGADREDVATGNPAEISTALTFGVIYSIVVLLSAAVSEHYGESMLYLVAIISGLTDVDAITLSTAHLFDESRISRDTAWRVIFVASLSNLLFKAGIVAVLGGAPLRRRLLPAMGGLTVVGALGVVLWP